MREQMHVRERLCKRQSTYHRYRKRNMQSGRIEPQITTTVVCSRRFGGTEAGTNLSQCAVDSFSRVLVECGQSHLQPA